MIDAESSESDKPDKQQDMIRLTTVSSIVDALGGAAATAELAGVNRHTVDQWQYLNRFPARTFLVLRPILEARRISAPDWLWPYMLGVSKPPANRRR